ncbi:MAG: hypothetical protein IKZ25_01685 [Clostridia bacterium]|nr:hypothetical protein [Clostridia bacterium]
MSDFKPGDNDIFFHIGKRLKPGFMPGFENCPDKEGGFRVLLSNGGILRLLRQRKVSFRLLNIIGRKHPAMCKQKSSSNQKFSKFLRRRKKWQQKKKSESG